MCIMSVNQRERIVIYPVKCILFKSTVIKMPFWCFARNEFSLPFPTASIFIQIANGIDGSKSRLEPARQSYSNNIDMAAVRN